MTLLLLPPLNSPPHLPPQTHHHHRSIPVPSRPRPPNTTHTFTGIALPLQITSTSCSSALPPPSSATNWAGGVGPVRTTRARRNNSLSGNSPPPFGVHRGHGRPHAIVIPGSRMGSLSGMAHAGSPLSTSSNGGGGAKGMGGICLGRVKARKPLFSPPFSSCFMKLMNYNRASEYTLNARLPLRTCKNSSKHHDDFTV